MRRYVERRAVRPRFAHGRSIRNAIDRARMRQASRLYARREALERADLVTIEAEDILASSVFDDEDGELCGALGGDGPRNATVDAEAVAVAT